MEGATLGSAVSHRGEEAKEEEEEEEEGRTEGRSPLDSGCVVCKRTPLNWTEAVVDEKWGLVGLCGTASLEVEVLEVELSTWTSGGPPGPADTPLSVVVSSFIGCARPRSVSAWMKDDDVVLLLSLVRDLDVVVVVLCEEILVNVGVVVLTPPPICSEDSFAVTPLRIPSVFVLEYKGVVEVEMKAFLVVVVE